MISRLKKIFNSLRQYIADKNIMMIFFTRNFRIIFLTVAVLSLCILSVYSVFVYSSANSKKNSQLQSLLDQTASGCDNIFESSVAIAENLSNGQSLFFVMNTNNITYPFNYASSLSSSMKSLAMLNSSIDSICVYSVKNNLFLSTDFSAQQWFHMPETDIVQNRTINMFTQTKLNDFPTVITIYRHFFDTAGKNYLGYLAVNINTLTLGDKLSASFAGDDIHLYVINDNKIIYSDNYDEIGSDTASADKFNNNSPLGKDENGKKFIAFECNSQINNMRYVMFDYSNSHKELLRTTLHSSLPVGILIFILSVIASLVLCAKIYIPYKNIISILQNDNETLMPTNYLTDLELIESYVRHYTQSNSILSNVISKQSAEIHQLTLASLQAQIHPHFIYNTIDCICWALYDEDYSADSIHKALHSLASLMKIVYDYSSSFISVSDESVFLTNYTNLFLFKYYNSFNVKMHFDEEMLSLMIPKMILQPIVENAFSHGICRSGGSGQIEIDGRMTDSSLIFTVCDSGSGIDSERLKKINRMLHDADAPMPKEHIGLYNVAKRLRLIYGSKASLELSVNSDGSSGLTVTMSIPLAPSS